MKFLCKVLMCFGCLFALYGNAYAVESSCHSHTEVDNSTSESSLKTKVASGEYTSLQVTCLLDKPTVLHFPLYYPDKFELTLVEGSPITSLASPHRAFLLPQGSTTFMLKSEYNRPLKLDLSLVSLDEFSRKNSVSIAIVFISSGFFLAMGVQVFIVGQRLKQSKLLFYPLYIFMAMLFLFFQEGGNNVIVPQWEELNSFAIRGPLGGLAILAAYIFLSSTLNLRRVMPPAYCKFMDILACAVVLIALMQPFVTLQNGRVLGDFMSYISVLLLAMIIIGNTKAISHQVIAAKLILLGISILFVSLGLRVFTYGHMPLISRYSLTFGLAIEAVIFSIAISFQVKNMRSEWARARHESQMDPLCPVLNRRGWFQYGRELLQVHRAQGGYLTVVFIDLDDFKKVNDTHGHNVGDELLVTASRIITQLARDEDIIGRIGGDEFVIMSHSHDNNDAKLIIKRLQNKFTDLSVTLDGLSIPLKASVGGKVFAAAQDDLQKMLHEVDLTMYSVKRERQSAQKDIVKNSGHT